MSPFTLSVVRIIWDNLGQTKNSFNTKWNNHRAIWKTIQSNLSVKDISDEFALLKHYYLKHNNNLINLDKKVECKFSSISIYSV